MKAGIQFTAPERVRVEMWSPCFAASDPISHKRRKSEGYSRIMAKSSKNSP